MSVVLSHFSEKEFKFNPNYAYSKEGRHFPGDRSPPMKPDGLWLSDESEFGWKEWCEDSGFRLEGLTHRADFQIDLADVCILNSVPKILEFHREYSRRPMQRGITLIDWCRVTDRYKGILISPYSWELRLEPEMIWYYGWDCASACIWDASILVEIDRFEVN